MEPKPAETRAEPEADLAHTVVILRRESRIAGLRAAALQAESEFLRQTIADIQSDRDSLRAELQKHAATAERLEQELAECQRKIARSPYWRFRALCRKLLQYVGLKS